MIAKVFLIIGIISFLASIISGFVRARNSNTYDVTGILDDAEPE